MSDQNQPIQLTKQGYEELKQELLKLWEKKRPTAVARVQRARDFGDLSENAEYHAARADLNFIDGRIEELEGVLNRAKVVGAGRSKKTVSLGCQVTVRANGKTRVFTIVGEWEADPAEQKISHESPLGQALVGKKVGDQVQIKAPAGTVKYLIKKIQ